jgi:drug/metabolite transporter (DMT)-like permease
VPTSASSRASNSAIWAALLVVYVAWGSTYVAIRVMDRTIPALLGAGIRYVAAGALMLAFLAVRRGALPRVSARQLASVALVGVLLLSGGNGFVTYGERHVPAGLAALLVASVPLWLVAIRLIARERLPRATLAALAIGFVGVALLVAHGRTRGVSVPQLLIIIGAALSWALGSWASSRLALPDDVAGATALEMLIGGVVLCALSPLFGERWGALGQASADSWLSILFLVVIGSIVAFTSYVWLLRNAPITRVSTYAYVNPAVAVALGTLLLGERITITAVIGGAVILVAVALVIRAEPRAGVAERSRD